MVQQACPLWRGVAHLHEALETAWSQHSEPDAFHAISMTGELCDSFATRTQGVAAIIDATAAILGTERVEFYAGPNVWFSPPVTDDDALIKIASANWMASASFSASKRAQAILVDVGSTTTDIIPLIQGKPAALGDNDASRLQHEELVYTGIVRTPVMAVCKSVPVAGVRQSLAAEYFANMADVYRVLEQLPQDADLHDTADGEAKSIEASTRRLYRMLGRDFDGNMKEARNVARYLAFQQLNQIQDAVWRVLGRMPQESPTLIAAGCGRFLVKRLARVLDLKCIDFADLFRSDGSLKDALNVCAPAAALAELGAARLCR